MEQKEIPFPIALIAIIAGVIVISLVLVPLFTGQWSNLGLIVGSGNPITQNQPYSVFTSVSVSSGFAFVITQSNSFSVKTTTDENLQNCIQISKVGDTLSVGLKPGYSVTTSTLSVEISMPSLSRLELSGGSHGNAQGFVSNSDFEIVSSEGSRIGMQGQAGNLKATVSGVVN